MFFSGASFSSRSHLALTWRAPWSPLIWRYLQPSVFHDFDSVEEYRARCLLMECFPFWICLKYSGKHFRPEYFTECTLALRHLSNLETHNIHLTLLVMLILITWQGAVQITHFLLTGFHLKLMSSLWTDTLRPCKYPAPYSCPYI